MGMIGNTKLHAFIFQTCLLIACIGIVTPGLPTTEFVLLAAWFVFEAAAAY